MLLPAAPNNCSLPCPSWGSCIMSWILALSWVKNKLAKRVLFLTRVSPLLGFTARLPRLLCGCAGLEAGEVARRSRGGNQGLFKAGAPLKVASQVDIPALNSAMDPHSVQPVFLKAFSRTNITADKAPALLKCFLVVMPCVADLSQSKFFSSLIFAIGTASSIQSLARMFQICLNM